MKQQVSSRVTHMLATVVMGCSMYFLAAGGGLHAEPRPSLDRASSTQLADGQWLVFGVAGELASQVHVMRPDGSSIVWSTTLEHPRAGFSTTLLPDGRVLILGGVDGAGAPVAIAEIFEPGTRRFRSASIEGLLPRARHAAAVLGDGRVLIAGGIDGRGAPALEAELWDPTTGALARIDARLSSAQLDPQATLLPDGSVALRTGRAAEIFDGETLKFRVITPGAAADLVHDRADVALTVIGTTPAAEAHGACGAGPLVVRFNKRMTIASLNGASVTLIGPAGAEPVDVVPAAQGQLTFVWPRKELLPASRYTLFLKGALDSTGRTLALTTVGFDTAAKPAAGVPWHDVQGGMSPTELAGLVTQRSRLGAAEQQALVRADHGIDPEDWIPGPAHYRGNWHADRAASPLQGLPPLRAPNGVSALAGQVLGMNGRAVPGVTLRIAGQEARTDVTGRFLLQGLAQGFAKLEIDGASASFAETQYGYYAARLEIKPAQTNVVPYVIWMPRLDAAGTVPIAAPTTDETIITSPRIPGLELRIPAGTIVRGRDGHIVTALNLTAIPVDRPPFPVPDLDVPVYFTVQPGGARLESVTGKPSQGARLFYPNFKHEVPRARGVFWNYDPEDREWFIYGLGTISRDGSQAIPDDGVVIHELTGAMFNGGNVPPPKGAAPCDCGDSGGDSVSLSTGQFQHAEHDLGTSDLMPIDVARTYDSADINQRAFGIGMTHGYDQFLFSQHEYQEVDLIQPTGTQVHYVRTSPGAGFANAVFESADPGGWTHSIISRNQTRFGWDMTFRDGRKLFFPQFQPVSEITDRNGNTTRIIRETNNGSSGKITQIVSPNGRTVDFDYNSAGFISALTDNLGRTFTYDYDDAGHLTEVVDPIGGKRQFTWDTENHRITAIRDPNGNLAVQNEYDDQGRVHKQTLVDGSTFTYVYTVQNGRITQTEVTDPRGSVRRVEFDATGHVVRNTFPVGLPEQQITTYEVTGGRATASTDALNRRTELTYDSLGNVTRVTKLAGTANAISIAMTYDPTFSVPLTITDPNGHTNTLTYDGKGNLTGVGNVLNQTAAFTYNAQGRLSTTTDPLHRVTTLAYDGADLSSVTDSLGRKIQYATDAAGRVIATVDPLGNRSFRDWDDQNRLLSTTDALGNIVAFSYDGNGNLRSQTDAKSHTTSYVYNELNQAIQITDPLLHDKRLQYEPGGEVKQVVDREGRLSSVIYDPLGRPRITGFGATELHPTAYKSQIENTFDAGNRLTQIVDRTCTDPVDQPNCSNVGAVNIITRGYDDLDRLTSETTLQGEVDYTYDHAGRRTSMTIKNGPPGARIVQPTITYSYDDADRLTGISQAAGTINAGVPQIITLAYDDAGQRSQTTLANGSQITYAHDDAGQLTAIVYKKADGSLIGDLHYGYDAAGRKTTVSGSLAQLSIPAADVTDAAYDANDRLLTWGGASYAYDANGNLTGDGTSTYEWNERDQLTRISDGSGALASFQYDSLGRRASKTIAAVTSGFLYDGANLVQELDGAASAAPVKAHLLTGGTDQVFTRLDGNDGANRQSVLTDASNSTLMLLDAAQNSTVHFAYEPYGATAADAAHNHSQQFTGRENDNPGNSQGLYYYRARYYMPGIARFISADPIGWASGQTNSYAYVGGNPISFTDPSGLDGWDDFENFSAGFGDALTLGLTRLVRDHFADQLGITGVNVCSGFYLAGGVVGTIVMVVATWGLGGEGKAAQTLFHGTDAESAASIVDRGLSLSKAARLGGGDVFWTTTDRAAAEFFAETNPAMGVPALVRIDVPGRVLSSLLRQGGLTITGDVYKFGSSAWNVLNEFATFTGL